ncbi:hypothetical protein RYH80_04565 [Halobaculum sp. MBLA0147]|uniref:hypothetical protein n=1 Tax=Halobaculum sp. MBLA0147 TaxID=3079934 RepID=UPI0035234DB3
MLVKSEWITGVVFSEDDPNRPQMELSDVSADDFPELVQALEAIDALDESLTEVDDGPHSEAQDDSEGSEESRDAPRDENEDR